MRMKTLAADDTLPGYCCGMRSPAAGLPSSADAGFYDSALNPEDCTPQQLRAENAELRIRLAEGDDIIRAIRSGEVDAVLAQGPQGEQLFTLKGADDPYRVLIEEMNQGAATLSADGLILYCNRRFGELLKRPLEKIVGLGFDSFVASEERPAFAALLETGRTASFRKVETLREVLIRAAHRMRKW